jgi:hypothetical protein
MPCYPKPALLIVNGLGYRPDKQGADRCFQHGWNKFVIVDSFSLSVISQNKRQRGENVTEWSVSPNW